MRVGLKILQNKIPLQSRKKIINHRKTKILKYSANSNIKIIMRKAVRWFQILKIYKIRKRFVKKSWWIIKVYSVINLPVKNKRQNLKKREQKNFNWKGFENKRKNYLKIQAAKILWFKKKFKNKNKSMHN